MRVVALVEALSLLVLFGNLATVHVPQVAAVVGPLHGTAYLAGIALACARSRDVRVRLLSLIPAVGAFLADRAIRSAERVPRERAA
ncbi:hypothetical protein FHX82_004430 [Amycolatopsis bartoniae]|uniref:DUF3817 domain-containing protein n=1 Tax=Amycolatopsis bartoniae TaxID=941986 RepID=A0A8H9IX85_9PSEU|nr:DUF3817 domain-containing protein [Amycolatopsis bartoniae]MBB2937357.1 hypothetical protein [Amycolatopsis bartoniae]TVT01603.1 DUF3817 domain-containing protein [Amycolatopsis bartoniae]GHF78417.1 hypothetical protein GCM10017566_60890 [Amycolatopsis bartoniae]